MRPADVGSVAGMRGQRYVNRTCSFIQLAGARWLQGGVEGQREYRDVVAQPLILNPSQVACAQGKRGVSRRPYQGERQEARGPVCTVSLVLQAGADKEGVSLGCAWADGASLPRCLVASLPPRPI